MKLLFKLIIALIIFVVLLAVGLVWYVHPTEKLDMTYSEISIPQKISEMLKRKKFEITLTNQEVGSLIKKQLVLHHPMPPYLEITGARFAISSNQLTAYTNLSINHSIQAAAVSYYLLEWKDPNVTATYLRTEVKGFVIPSKWLQASSIDVPLSDLLPAVIGIKGVSFEEGLMKIAFKLLN